jgi:hypothetical protein
MIDAKLILNVLIALFIYNVILKAVGATIAKEALKTKTGEKTKEYVKKSFSDRINELKEEKANELN